MMIVYFRGTKMKILVIHSDGKNEILSMKDICIKYRITEKKVQFSIKSGHHLKTMLFREVEDEYKIEEEIKNVRDEELERESEKWADKYCGKNHRKSMNWLCCKYGFIAGVKYNDKRSRK